MSDEPTMQERERRWRLAIGAETGEDGGAGLAGRDLNLSRALSVLYDAPPAASRSGRRGGLGRSAPKVAAWMDDIRSFFPSSVVRILQQDAFERLDLKQMLIEPEFLQAVEADVGLVADLMSLRSIMPERTKDVAREVVAKVVAELLERLERRMSEALRGATNRARRHNRPRFRDIDWPRTIRANLRHYQPEQRAIVAEKLVGFQRRQRRIVDLDEVVLCVDQSGSMASSVVYASIFAAVMASLPVVRTRLVCFDTAVLDLTDDLADPVDALFGIQLGGGTDINQAVAYCAERIERPAQSHLVLVTDLYEGGDKNELLRRLAALVRAGVNVVVLLALSDSGRPGFDETLAAKVAALGVPVFSCTPDRFPDLMATALRREDIAVWAGLNDLKLVTAQA